MQSTFQNVTDEALARQSQGGSLEAFEELVYRYESRIYSFVAQCCANAVDAQEITQDTFVKAYQALGQYDPERPFTGWLFTIARRKMMDYLRRRRSEPLDSAPEPFESSTPSDTLVQNEEEGVIWKTARRVLPEVQFQALWLQYVEEFSVRDIATALGKSKVHVKVLLFRARRALARDSMVQDRAAGAVKLKHWPPSAPETSPELALKLPKQKGAL